MPSEVDSSIPEQCEITFVSVLSRHGARDPTARKSDLYQALVERIQTSVAQYGKGYEFLQDYQYTLGKDQLTLFGQQQMVDLGAAFHDRYKSLVSDHDPYIRAAGSDRVIESAHNFTQGLYKLLERNGDEKIEDILIIPETAGFNNTLNHGGCPEFEEGRRSDLGRRKQNVWKELWTPSVRDRLNQKLPGVDFTLEETVYMMDLCPFNSVATTNVEKSDFCRLFSLEEWRDYDYFESVEKWYGYGPGNALGASQGVGYVNELIARLTGLPVQDETTTNSTLDSSPETFPLDKKLYADFSHDNTMISIYAAMGLYNGTSDLPLDHRLPPQETGGYSAAWTVPFAGRMFVEKMRCGDGDGDGHEKESEELVRVLINDRVVPLHSCEADELGRCRLSSFVHSLSFARDGGRWHQCFT